MATLEALLDPTGATDRGEDPTLATRPGSLKGKTVGLLDNTKVNAKPLLDSIAAELGRRHGFAETRDYTKDYFGTPVTTDILDLIVSECDVVITAVGDCGSCSAATVADGIHFERAGLPAVSICSDSFVISGQAMAQVEGFPGYEFLTAAHPVASLDADEIRHRAADLIPGIERILGLEG